MIEGVRVRRAGVGDAAGIAAVHVASWQRAYRGLMPAELLDALSVPARTQRWAQNLGSTAAGAATFVAEQDGEVIGFASIGPCRDEDAETAAELWALYLHPRHWGAGHGHVLHAHAVRALAATGAADATLWVLTTNQRARRFYERHGWAADGATKVVALGDAELAESRYRLPGLAGAAGVTVLP
ncbi:MAG: GNAT family N-acetyltransferase [Actinomycetota bacterium]